MPKISKQKKDRISEQILNYLFTVSPEAKFTSEISIEIARDEEFTKTLLQDLRDKKLIIEINKNKDGQIFLKRQRWRLSNDAYIAYSSYQSASRPSTLGPQSEQFDEDEQSLK